MKVLQTRIWRWPIFQWTSKIKQAFLAHSRTIKLVFEKAIDLNFFNVAKEEEERLVFCFNFAGGLGFVPLVIN